jgi:hypothetical protein
MPPERLLDAAQDGAFGRDDGQSFVPLELVRRHVVPMETVRGGDVFARTEVARNREMDGARVDVAELVEVKRRLVAQHAAPPGPQHRLHVRVQRGHGHQRHAVETMAKMLQGVPRRHLAQQRGIDVQLARILGREVAVLLLGMVEERVEYPTWHAQSVAKCYGMRRHGRRGRLHPAARNVAKRYISCIDMVRVVREGDRADFDTVQR